MLSQDITPVNDAPTTANVANDSVTFTEGQALAALLDLGSNATVADVDSANFDSGTLTVAITGGLVGAEDRLVIRLTGTISFNATAVFVNGTQIGTYTGHNSSGPLVFTFDADATPAAVAELIRAIAYNNVAGDNPTDGDRTITWTLVDGDGTANTGVDTVQFTTTVDVDPVNDAPLGTDATFAFNEDGSRILAAADFGFSDPAEGHGFAGVVITTLPTNGVLLLNGVPITVAGTFVTAAQIAANQLVFQSDPNENGTPYATFTFQVRDNGGTLDGGVDTDQSANTLTFNVDPVNDAPVIGNIDGDNLSYIEGAGTVLLDPGSDLTISDVDSTDFNGGLLTVTISASPNLAEDVVGIDTSGTVALSAGLTLNSEVSVGGVVIGIVNFVAQNTIEFLLNADATPARVEALARAYTYTNNAGDTPFGGARTVSWTLVDGDGGNQQTTAISLVTVVPVNDAPAGANATVTASEDDPYVFLTADFGFSDVEGNAFAGVVLTTLPVEGDLRLNGVAITVAGTFISAADIAGGLLTFLADPDEFGAAYASFTFQVRDDGGILNGGVDTDQSANTMTIDVEPDNIPPLVDLNGAVAGLDNSAAYTEQAPIVTLAGNLVLSDDGPTLTGATVRITAGFVPLAGDGADYLGIAGSGAGTINGITYSYSALTGILTLTGTASVADYQAVLRQVSFQSTTNDPGASKTVTWTVNDGTDDSNMPDTVITVTEVNDAPALAATGANAVFTEGDAAVDLFSAVDATNFEAAQTYTSLTLTVSNVTDGAAEVLNFDGSAIALTNGNAVTTAGNGLNVTVTLAAGVATVTFSGAALSEAQLEALVDGLSYANTSENPTDADRVITITQIVDSGPNGGADDNNTNPNLAATVNVNPVNDAPVNSVPGTQVINEDGSVTLSTGNGNALSVSDADATTLTVTLTVQHGTLTLASTAGLSFGAGDGTNDLTMTFTGTAAAINAALGSGLTYSPEANFNGSDTIAVSTTDNGQSGGPAQTDNDNITVNITAINDAPVVIGDGTESAATIDEDSPGGGQTIQALFSGQYSDAADNQIPNGGASSPGQFSGIAVVANGSSPATGVWQYFNGTSWVAIGAASPGAAVLLGSPFTTLIRFQPAPDFNGPAPTLTVHLIDNSLPFGIVNGMVVDISGPGATGGTTAYSSGNVVLSQDVTAVNDGPLNTVPGAQVINEDGSFTLSSGNGNAISVADVDAASLTVTLTVANGTLTLASTAGLSFGAGDGSADLTMTFTGTAAAINAALGSGLTYNPNANYNGPDAIAVLTTDNGQTGSGGPLQDNDSINITVNSVNDAPQGTDNIVTGSEDDPYVFTLADFGFSDPVEGDDFLAVIIDSFPANGTLFLDPDGPGGAAPVDLATIGAGVFVSVTDIDAGRLYFQPDPDEFGDGYATFTFRVQDDGGTANGGVDRDPVANTITIDIEPDNLPPVVDLNGAGAGIDYVTTFVEDGAAVAIGSGISVSDPDAVPLGDLIESATVTLTDRVAGDSLSAPTLPPGFTAIVTNLPGSITIQISGPGTGAQYQAMIESILYSTTNQDPTVGGTDLARTVTVTVNDGDIDSAVATTTININAVDDLPVAQADAFTITESGTIVAGNLFADNGAGADSDPDGPPLAISAVNGSGGNVGMQIVLASGALLTVNANGTFDYNPDGAFLPTPTAGSGASNTPASDSFTYTLAGGNTVTVTITLTGLDTDDFLLGTAGADVLTGGNGNDIYVVENAADQVFEAAGEGNDVIYALVSYQLTGGQEIERLSTVDWSQTDALDLTGNGIANLLEGNAGVNVLNGAGGADVMVGFGGDDIYVVDDAGDQVIEVAGGGNDVVYALADYTLGEGTSVERLSSIDWTQTAALNLTGSSAANLIEGNAGVNVLNGAGGADILVGFGGDDIYVVDDAGDQVIEAAAGGSDVVYALVDYMLTAGQEIERLSAIDWSQTTALNLTGNGLANLIEGNAGANVLDGGGGADTLVGFGGNDNYYVDNAGDTVIEAVGGGSDTVFASTSYTLTAGQEIEFLLASSPSGTDAINLTGNEFDNTIYGNDGDNVLDGKGGSDLLVGLAGADTFAFTTAPGAGNVDVVLGFEAGIDRIALDDAVFTAIGPPGGLNANAFVTGAAAADASDRIIYNNLTGQLFYDADGSGAGEQVLFAILSPGLTLTASDFMVI